MTRGELRLTVFSDSPLGTLTRAWRPALNFEGARFDDRLEAYPTQNLLTGILRFTF